VLVGKISAKASPMPLVAPVMRARWYISLMRRG
jgi:hypothetical protein